MCRAVGGRQGHWDYFLDARNGGSFSQVAGRTMARTQFDGTENAIGLAELFCKRAQMLGDLFEGTPACCLIWLEWVQGAGLSDGVARVPAGPVATIQRPVELPGNG